MPGLKRLSELAARGEVYDLTRVAFFFDDFIDEYALTTGEPVTGTSPWIGTPLSSGTTAFANDVNGGTCILANDGTNTGSGSQIQLDTESFALQTSKDLVFGCRVKLGTPSAARFFFGLGITDTTLLAAQAGTAAAFTTTAALGFFVAVEGATVYMVGINGLSTVIGQSTVKATVVADTWYLLEAVVRGSSTSGAAAIEVFIDGVYVGTYNYSGMSTTEMAITCAYVSGAAGTAAAQSATFDFVYAATER